MAIGLARAGRGTWEGLGRGEMAVARGLVRSMRPHQWVKNSFLFAGALFAAYAGAAITAPDLLSVGLAFLCFCLLSGAVYLLNDVVDRDRDREHPTKRKRPVASGVVPVPVALAWAGTSIAAAGCLAWLVGFRSPHLLVRESFAAIAVAYLGLNVAYSFWLKNCVLLDVLVIALGFVLRVIAGCVAIPVPISPWILVCTMLLALLLGLCKRRHELLLLGDGNASTRRVLPHYSLELLNQLIAQTGAAALVSYLLYTLQPHHGYPSGDPRMLLTVPFVICGIWRYQSLAYRKDMGANPEMAFRDRYFLTCGFGWASVVMVLTLLR